MNRSFLSVFAVLVVSLSLAFRCAEANNCNPPAEVSGETVAWAWGWNGFGQLGDGTADDRHTPIPVPLSGVAALAAGFAIAWGSRQITRSGPGVGTPMASWATGPPKSATRRCKYRT